MRVAYSVRVLPSLSADSTQICIDAAQAVTKLTEDPPFGGLWCDQPALFLPRFFASILALRHAADQRHERIEVHRLRHVQIEACIDRGLDISLRRITRHCNG